MKCALCRKSLDAAIPAIISLDDGFADVKSHAVCHFCKSKLFENMEELFREEKALAVMPDTTKIVAHTNKRLNFQEMAAIIESFPVSKESQPLGFDPDDYPLS